MFRKGYTSLFVATLMLASLGACSGQAVDGSGAASVPMEQRADRSLEVPEDEIMGDAKKLLAVGQEAQRAYNDANFGATVIITDLNDLNNLSGSSGKLSSIDEAGKTKLLAKLDALIAEFEKFLAKYDGWKSIRVKMNDGSVEEGNFSSTDMAKFRDASKQIKDKRAEIAALPVKDKANTAGKANGSPQGESIEAMLKRMEAEAKAQREALNNDKTMLKNSEDMLISALKEFGFEANKNHDFQNQIFWMSTDRESVEKVVAPHSEAERKALLEKIDGAIKAEKLISDDTDYTRGYSRRDGFELHFQAETNLRYLKDLREKIASAKVKADELKSE